MKKMNNKKGFTLIELLAVIVILGIIMGIAIPSMTGYINNSRKDTMLSSAMQYISSVRTMLITENALPAPKEALIVPVDLVAMEKGGTSPYTNKAFSNNYSSSTYDGKSYVLVFNNLTSAGIDTVSTYTYLITLYDEKKNCLTPVTEKFLTNAPTRSKRSQIATAKSGSSNPCINQIKLTETPQPAIPEAGSSDQVTTTFKYLDYDGKNVVTKEKSYTNKISTNSSGTSQTYTTVLKLYQ